MLPRNLVHPTSHTTMDDRSARPRRVATSLARILATGFLPAIAAGALVQASCSPARRPSSILIVTIDTLRADRIGCYGRFGARTPVIDALAARGAVFLDATAPAPITLPSHASLFTGQDPCRHGVRDNALFALPPGGTTLAERARDGGLRTGAFVASIVVSHRYGLDQGFERYADLEDSARGAAFLIAERPATEVNRHALEWLRSIGSSRFLAWVHYIEPHAPYHPPGREVATLLFDPYQGEISEADRALGALLDELASLGRLDETLVIVTSDHGEGLGDHGEATHGSLVYQSTLRVPLVMAGPGIAGGRRIDHPVALVDVAPTVVEATGFEALPDQDGVSLWRTLQGDATLVRDGDIYAETFSPRYTYGWSPLRVLRSGPWKYVSGPRPELYRIDTDPAESLDVIASQPEIARGLRQRLQLHVARAELGAIPPGELQPTDDEIAALHSLGYVMHVAEAVPTSGQLANPRDRLADLVQLEVIGDLLRRGQLDEASRGLRSIIVADPTCHQARIMLFTCLLFAGDFAAAEAEGRHAVAIAQRGPDGRRIAASTEALLGEMYERVDRQPEAIAAYERSLAVPQSRSLILSLARLQAMAVRHADSARTLALLVDRGEPVPSPADLVAPQAP